MPAHLKGAIREMCDAILAGAPHAIDQTHELLVTLLISGISGADIIKAMVAVAEDEPKCLIPLSFAGLMITVDENYVALNVALALARGPDCLNLPARGWLQNWYTQAYARPTEAACREIGTPFHWLPRRLLRLLVAKHAPHLEALPHIISANAHRINDAAVLMAIMMLIARGVLTSVSLHSTPALRFWRIAQQLPPALQLRLCVCYGGDVVYREMHGREMFPKVLFDSALGEAIEAIGEVEASE